MILFITRKYPPAIGGMERLSYFLTKTIADRRPTAIIAWGRSQVLLPLFMVMALARAVRVLLQRRVRIIHIGDPVLAPLGLFLKLTFGLPVVITVHGLDITFRNPLYQLIVPRIVARHDWIVAISAQTRAECLARGIPSDRCSIIPVGIKERLDLPSRAAARQYLERRFSLDLARRSVLLTIGRLVPRKGVAWFVEHSLPLIKERCADVLYLVVGEGPDFEEIERLSQDQGLSGNVVLLGSVDDEALWAAYRACDLFIMPNQPVPGNIEGFGLVSIEACLAECCVVASDLEGIRDAIHHDVNGFLVPAGDATAMSNTVLSLLNDAVRRGLLGQHARGFVLERFGWSRVAEQYLAIFDSVEAQSRADRQLGALN